MSETKKIIDSFIKNIEEENGGKLEGILDEVVSVQLDNLLLDITCAIEECQSPIEKAFSINFNKYKDMSILGSSIHGIFEYTPQFEITTKRGKKYRVDFFAEYANEKTRVTQGFVIECDGHEFHEKTKEQAANDRQRERDLMLEGYIVIRFTGSEIFKAPAKCAREAVKIIEKFVIEKTKA